MLAGAVRACDTNTAPRTQGRGSQTDCEGLHFSVMSWRTHPHLAEISGPTKNYTKYAWSELENRVPSRINQEGHV